MAFYRNPIIEEPARCLVCSDEMPWDSTALICSSSCQDIWDVTEERLGSRWQQEDDPEEALYA